MADEQIAIRVEVEGAEKGARDLGSLADKVKGLEAASRKSARQVTRLEAALERERATASTTAQSVGRLSAAERQHGQAMQASGATMTDNSMRAGRLVSAFGSMGSAMSLLGPGAARLGGALSAVGSSIANTTATMGPFGIVLGAVTIGLGLLVPALAAASDETEELGAAAHETGQKMLTLESIMNRIAAERRRVESEEALAQGMAPAAEHRGAAQMAAAELGGHAGTPLSRLAARRRRAQSALRNAQRAARPSALRAETAAQSPGSFMRRERQRVERQQRVEAAQRELDLVQQQIDAREAELSETVEEQTGFAEVADTQMQVTQAEVGGRARSRRLATKRRLEQRRIDEKDDRTSDEALQRMAATPTMSALSDPLAGGIEAAMRSENLQIEEERVQAMDEVRGEVHQAEMERLNEEKQKRDEMHAAELSQQEQTVRKFSEAGAAVGGFFTDIYGQMTGDQKTFEEAFITSFKNMMIERGGEAVFEGTKMIFEGIGMLMAPGKQSEAGLKIGAGAGLIALGIGVGAAGASISVPGGGGSPESPRAGGGAGDGGAKSDIVINMSGPMLTATTEANVGRTVRRSLRQAERVYGSAA